MKDYCAHLSRICRAIGADVYTMYFKVRTSMYMPKSTATDTHSRFERAEHVLPNRDLRVFLICCWVIPHCLHILRPIRGGTCPGLICPRD